MDIAFHTILPAGASEASALPFAKGGLYLGSMDAVRPSVDHLHSLGISVIVSAVGNGTRSTIPKDNRFSYYHINIHDFPTEPLGFELLEAVCDYIDQKRNNGMGVLVHCGMASHQFFVPSSTSVLQLRV